MDVSFPECVSLGFSAGEFILGEVARYVTQGLHLYESQIIEGSCLGIVGTSKSAACQNYPSSSASVHAVTKQLKIHYIK